MKKYLHSNIIDIKNLLTLTLNKPLSWIYANNNYQLNSIEKQRLKSLIKRREKGEPFAYLKGTKEFYGLDFIVNKYTLIPRPETELIIDIAKNLSIKTVLDLGTGSGIIAITLKYLKPNLQIFASDFSINALKVAKKNAKKLQTNINFSLSNWLESFQQKFDLIICNPPYIKENDKHLKTLKFEPITALASGKDGLRDIRIIINNAKNHLNHKGYLLLEHGYNQRKKIINLFDNKWQIKTFDDLNLQHRVVLAKLC